MPRVRRAAAEQQSDITARVERRSIELGGVPRQPPSKVPAPDPPKVPAHTTAAALATRALHRKAAVARGDLPEFYGMVAKHETTKKPLKPAPHQLVMFKFMVDHPHCVVRMPVGTTKTFGTAFTALWLMGQDVTQRGAIVSKAQGQAAKVLRMVSDYITEPSLNPPLIMVFPWLQRSGRPGDLWTQTALTVDRPAGIRDPSFVAVGIDGAITGARLSWVVADDLLDADNTLTDQARDKVHSNFDARILSRLDPTGSRAIVMNTPWHREDLTYKLEEAGWPTLSMDIYGNIWFTNVSSAWIAQLPELRLSKLRDRCYRLVAHDPDPEEETPLWPDRYDSQTIADIRIRRLPHEFARLFLCQPFDEDAARCQRSWIEACKMYGLSLAKEYNGPNPVYTGVDVGVGQGRKNDLTSMFTFELLPDLRRKVLDVESGRWSGPVIADKVIEKHDRFNSMLSVESNAAQDFIRQFVKEQRSDLRVRAHTTSRVTKHSVDFGVESVFTELKQKRWIIPCDENGRCVREVQAWIEEMLGYQPPPAHTGDRLMACWIGREASRRGGGGRDPKPRVGLQLQSARGGGF